MIKPEVKTWIGGSHCVVSLNPSGEHYIESHKDVRHPDLTRIEVVLDGQVHLRNWATLQEAPEYIVTLMRSYSRYGTCGLKDWRLAAIEAQL